MPVRNLRAIIDNFSRSRILVVGDVMLDSYWVGETTRISPEAPVPVVTLTESYHVPGGAANVAMNVRSLGGKVILVGLTGDDPPADQLTQLLNASGIDCSGVVADKTRPTTVKTRVLSRKHQLVRIDVESAEPISGRISAALTKAACQYVEAVDVVVLSDYAKGALAPSVIAAIISCCRRMGKLVLVDPKGRTFEKYAGATVIKPNLNEAAMAVGVDISGSYCLDRAANAILEKVPVERLLITLGDRGMRLYSRDVKPYSVTARTRRVYDVTGAGDTVISTLAVALGGGADIYSAIDLANVAAGIAVEKVGTSAVFVEEILAALTDGGQQ